MRARLTLCSALTLVLVSATGSFAQQLQYDRSMDHMASYGPVLATTHTPAVTPRQARVRAPAHAPVPLDRTADHMFYYGPIQ